MTILSRQSGITARPTFVCNLHAKYIHCAKRLPHDVHAEVTNDQQRGFEKRPKSFPETRFEKEDPKGNWMAAKWTQMIFLCASRGLGGCQGELQRPLGETRKGLLEHQESAPRPRCRPELEHSVK